MPFRKLTLGICLLLLALAAPALASVAINIDCDEAQSEFLFTVEVFNQMVEDDVTGWEIVFEQTWVGACEQGEILAAVALPPFLAMANYTFSLPVPAVNQTFLYTAKLRTPEGTIQDLMLMSPSPWGVASCGEAMVAQGLLVESTSWEGFYDLVPCPDSCDTWLCTDAIDLSQVPAEQWAPYVGSGITVDIFGSPGWIYPMAGSPCLYASEVRPTADGACGPVPSAQTTWDSLKAKFR